MMQQLRLTQDGLRHKEAEPPSPYSNSNFFIVPDSTGMVYCWQQYIVSEETEDDDVYNFVVLAPFQEGESELNVVAVIPPPRLFYTLYEHNSGGVWHVFGYVDDKDNFYATVTDKGSWETVFKWDWVNSSWTQIGVVAISELGWKDSFTAFLKPNKPLGWVTLNPHKVANVFGEGNVVTTSNYIITSIGPYIYTYNDSACAIEIFSPEADATSLGEPVVSYETGGPIGESGNSNKYWVWVGVGREALASLAPNDFSIVFAPGDYYTSGSDEETVRLYLYFEIKLDGIKIYTLPYSLGDDQLVVYLGESADSPPPRFWANLVGCTEKP